MQKNSTVPTVIYEDNHLLGLNKPAGWLVQGDHTGDPTLGDWGKQYLKDKYLKPGAVFLTPAHRIDRPVSGAVLLARTDKALGRLTDLFRTRDVQKTYLALVVKAPKQATGELRHWLLKDEQRNVVKAFDRPQGAAKESVLSYEVVDQRGTLTLLEIKPLTGRPHQIRVQLASIGCPILGDLKYGANSPLRDASIALHSHKIELIHPVKREPLVIEAPLPEAEWWRL
jgi:23S rRNA pseudouridine1911/1915/1917 synthase